MIHEGENPNYQDVIDAARTAGRVICQHDEDFWDNAKKLTYGDIILCQRCGQYFTRIKHMIIVKDKKEILTPRTDICKLIIKPRAEHSDKDCLIRVPVRIIDA
jgi:hypothetical protein